MRRTLLFALLVFAAPAAADDRHGRRHDTDLFIQVPLEHDTGVVFPFGGSHHAVPGVVTINRRDPYYCRPHKQAFSDRAGFVEHLGVRHGLTDREIPGMVVVENNQVRYVGD